MAEYRVVEKFVSINGEGQKSGQITAFIRLQICNLRCSYCDTEWANTEDSDYELMSDEEIINWLKETGMVNVTVTGGEPLLHKNMENLFKKMYENGNYIEVETNGSIDISKFNGEYRKNLSFTIDYKLPSSNMESRMDVNNYKYLTKRDTVKFVAGSIKDLERAKFIIEKYDLIKKSSVYISPIFGKIDPKDIVEFMISNNMNGVNLQIQIHKVIWDPDKRGV